MNIERLTRLAEIRGADLRRWPEDERAAAQALAAADPAARAVLDDAASLDALLDAAPRIEVSQALRDRVLASAIETGLKPRAGRGLNLGLGLDRIAWFLGAGWAAAACAGVVAGVGLTSHVTADDRVDAVLYQSSLMGVDDTEVLG